MLDNSINGSKNTSIIIEVRLKGSKNPASCTLIGSAFIKSNEVLGRRIEESFEVLLKLNLNRESVNFRRKNI